MLEGCSEVTGRMLGDLPCSPGQQEPEPSAGRAGFGGTAECWCHLEGTIRLKSGKIITAHG